jgi:hypothetical protein
MATGTALAVGSLATGSGGVKPVDGGHSATRTPVTK